METVVTKGYTEQIFKTFVVFNDVLSHLLGVKGNTSTTSALNADKLRQLAILENCNSISYVDM